MITLQMLVAAASVSSNTSRLVPNTHWSGYPYINIPPVTTNCQRVRAVSCCKEFHEKCSTT